MKTTQLTIKEEHYCDCPYCSELNSDEINQGTFYEGDILVCDNCKKKFLVGGKRK